MVIINLQYILERNKKVNLKITKKCISILSAATISISSIGASVSAIKAYPGNYALAEIPANLKNAVDHLNNSLKSSNDTINVSMNHVTALAEDYEDNDETLTKIATIMSTLDQIKTQMAKWDEFCIEKINLVNETNNKINNLGLNQILEDLNDINKLDSINNRLSEKLKIVEDINVKLEQESKRLLSKDFNAYLNNENNNNNDDNFNLLNSNYQIDVSFNNNNNINLINNNHNSFCLLNDNKQKEKLDADLVKEINQIHNSNEPIDKKIEKIVNVLESKKFNDYKKELDVILPIIDSLYIAGDKKVGDVFQKLSQNEINNNKELRNKLRKFVSKCVIQYIDEQLSMYMSNDITKPLAEHINAIKDIISNESVDTIITTTFHEKYIKSNQLFDVVNDQLSQYERNFLDTHKDKNLVKTISQFQLSVFLDNLIEKNNKAYDEVTKLSMSKQLLDSFDKMFRQYVKRITGMKTNLEVEAGYGENNGEDIPDGELIGLQEAINKWGYNSLEQHYIRDKVTKDNLNDVFKKYKSIKNLYDKMYEPLYEFADLVANISTEEDLKKTIANAKKELDNFQNHLVVIDNNSFYIIED